MCMECQNCTNWWRLWWSYHFQFRRHGHRIHITMLGRWSRNLRRKRFFRPIFGKILWQRNEFLNKIDTVLSELPVYNASKWPKGGTEASALNFFFGMKLKNKIENVIYFKWQSTWTTMCPLRYYSQKIQIFRIIDTSENCRIWTPFHFFFRL